MPLTPEEEASLAELEAEVASAAPPVPPNAKVRADRFSGAPVGMRDDGALFPLTPDTDTDDEAPAAPPSK